MRNILLFFVVSYMNVSGEVLVELMPYHFNVLACESKYDMMSVGEYGEKST